MKKFLLLITLLMMLSSINATKLVQINYQSDKQVKSWYSDKNISIRYIAKDFVLASVEDSYVGDGILLDQEPFEQDSRYYIAWFYKEFENDYLQQIEPLAEVLAISDNYIILKADHQTSLFPPVQGYIMHVDNKELVAPKKGLTYNKGTLLYDQEIADMMEEVDETGVVDNITHLQEYGTRNTYSPEAIEAQNWIKAEYESYGYTVELFDFTMPGGASADNVIATKLGTKYPEEYVVIGGHYDSYAFSGDAPGADDDASGTCGVMEVARVMADYETDRTVIFCAWAGEEYGLYGSEAWADWAAGEGYNILGYFNIDMCGYLHPGDEIHTDVIAPASAQPLVDFYTDVCTMYLPDFGISPGALSGGDSDHTSFNNAGYMGIFPFEDSQNYSPYIHTPDDVVGLSVNSPEMVKTFTQAMVANVATMANWLAPPSNLVAIPGDGTIELVWNELLDIDNYNVYKNNDTTPIASPLEPTYLDEDVENFTTYTYYVTAIYTETGEESNPSNMVTVTPLPPMAFPYEDDFEDGAFYWSFDSPWGLTTSQSYSPSHSITESPSGNYPNNQEAIATLYSFSLENAIEAHMSFMTKYQLETNYDYMYLEISTNGNIWTTLETFNGNQNSWTSKEYTLEDYLGEPFVNIRFRFYSDTWITEDGMYIDDFVIEVEDYVSGTDQENYADETVKVTPNPFRNHTNVYIYMERAGSANIKLFDITGSLILENSQECRQGQNSLKLTDQSLEKGIYFLEISTGEKSFTRKLISQ